MVQTPKVAEVLGVKASSIRELSQVVERGLPKTALTRTVNRVVLERGAAKRFMSGVVPEATFKRRTRLSPAESERTERLARVIAGAEYVWDDQSQAREWLHSSHSALDNKSPLEATMTELGARRVEELLDRIFYGLPA